MQTSTCGNFKVKMYLPQQRSPGLHPVVCPQPVDLEIISCSLSNLSKIAAFNQETYIALHQSTIASIARDEPGSEVGQTHSAFSMELSRKICWITYTGVALEPYSIQRTSYT